MTEKPGLAHRLISTETKRSESAAAPAVLIARALSKRSIFILFSPAFDFQHVDEHAQQHVHHVVERFYGRDGTAAGPAGPHVARHFHKAEAAGAATPPALRSPDTPAGNCAKTKPAPCGSRPRIPRWDRARSCPEWAAARRERRRSRRRATAPKLGPAPLTKRDPITISQPSRSSASRIPGMSRGSCWPSPSTRMTYSIAQLERQPVAGLHAAAEPQVMRQRQHARAGLARAGDSGVGRSNRPPPAPAHPASRREPRHHARHRALFIEGRDQDHQLGVRSQRRHLPDGIECRASNCSNSLCGDAAAISE